MMDFELWILDSFSIFLRFEISENFPYDNGVVEVPMIEVHIRQKILVQRTENRRHIGFFPSRVFQQNHRPGHSAISQIVEINSCNILALALGKKALR